MARQESRVKDPGPARAGRQPAPAMERGTRARTAPGVSPHHDEAAATELARNAFARDRAQFLMRGVIALLALNGLSTVANIYLAAQPVRERYFTVDPGGQIRPLNVLTEPVTETVTVVNFVAEAIAKSYTIDFANYDAVLADIRKYFTDRGWQSYEQAMTRSGFLDRIRSSRLVSTAAVTKAPVIVQQGAVGDTYAWVVQVPIVVTSASAAASDSQTLTAEVTVVRRPVSENPAGLGIAIVRLL